MESGEEPQVLAVDIDAAFKAIPSFVTPEMIKQYEAFNTRRFGS